MDGRPGKLSGHRSWLLPEAVRRAVDAVLAVEEQEVAELFRARLERHWPQLDSGLRAAYGDVRGRAAATRAAVMAAERHLDRPEDLRALDRRRLAQPDWFQHPSVLGYAAYADRFAGTLRGVAQRVPYLVDLGVTYLHLLPLLKPRPGPDDGGYAVADFRAVREDLGTMDDLVALAARLREAGISLVLDLVMNHVARENDWAVRARAGDEHYRHYFHIYPDRTLPDAFERSLPEVFPDFAPGNFSWDDDLGGWVWTTFNSWQWDLNWGNPDVFLEYADLVCFLANQGAECLRLDAIAFVWKRLGTSCQNQPEVHDLTQALRAVAAVAAPAVVFKAEAIVGPEDLLQYLGTDLHAGHVSDLAYHNSFMVQLWSALATQDARLMVRALRRFTPKPPSTAWATYVRCHDDIGWAVDDGDAASVGWNGWAHRRFLSEWFSGAFPGSSARGLIFQENPATGDRRISGTSASLAGLEAALSDEGRGPEDIDTAVRRILLLHLAMLSFGGVPLIWMGDELALCNDPQWAAEPGHEDDNRWAHRPKMPWVIVDSGLRAGSPADVVFTGLRQAGTVRARQPALHAATDTQLLELRDPALLAWLRPHGVEPLVALHNLSGGVRTCPRWQVPVEGPLRDALTDEPVAGDEVVVPPYGVRWLVRATSPH